MLLNYLFGLYFFYRLEKGMVKTIISLLVCNKSINKVFQLLSLVIVDDIFK